MVQRGLAVSKINFLTKWACRHFTSSVEEHEGKYNVLAKLSMCQYHFKLISHLTAPISHMDLGHVGHLSQALHAVSLPAPHWFGQDLQFKVLALP